MMMMKMILSLLLLLIVKIMLIATQPNESASVYTSLPIENRSAYYKRRAGSQETNWLQRKSTNRKRRTIETESGKISDFPAVLPLIRDTLPNDDGSPSFDLSRHDRFWSNLQFFDNPTHPNLLLQDPNDKMEDEMKNKPATLPNNSLAKQNRSILNFLQMLQNRLQKNRWRSLGMSEINIPQDVIGEYLLDLIAEPSNKGRSQSLKNNLLTEEMILPLIWDESVSERKPGKQNGRRSYKRTFLSQSWKPGGLAEKQTNSLQREKNRQESKSSNQNAYTMSVLGLHGWRPGKKSVAEKFYQAHDEDEDDYAKSPETSKEMVTLHISSHNSPRRNDDRDINMQIKNDVVSANDEQRSGRALMEKLKGKMDDDDDNRWKMMMFRQRQNNV